ncbi:MAG: hypothetical protein JW718_09120 [Desulfovibrionaceae bacterium]|nr:hypothetical protein [Desulfovibrionaceae bacterium]
MPVVRIETNVAVDEPDQVLSRLSAFCAEALGKPEGYVLAVLEPGKALVFGGAAGPAALVTLESIDLARQSCPALSERICAFVRAELGVPGERVYIGFRDLDGGMFGWNGRTF